MSLLEEEDFSEARNVSALFLVREWLRRAKGEFLRRRRRLLLRDGELRKVSSTLAWIGIIS